MTKRTYPTATQRKKREQALLIEQLRKTPIVQIACEKTGVSRAAYYRWRKENAAFATYADEALIEGTLLMNDMAESQLLSAVRDGDMKAITFWLRSRHHAFGNKIELKASVEHKDRTLTPEERALVRKALKLGGFS